MAKALDQTNYHAFLAANRWVVLHATAVDTMNPFIARHFRSAHAGRVQLASVNLLTGAAWFREEVERSLGRTPNVLESGYYLAIDGTLVSYQSGRDPEAYGAALAALFSNKSAADVLEERNARKVIASFEARLAKAPPARPASAPSLGPAPEPHEILGIAANATPEEIDEAYHRCIRENHPDRVATMAREIRDLATKRTAVINAAYAELRRRASSSR